VLKLCDGSLNHPILNAFSYCALWCTHISIFSRQDVWYLYRVWLAIKTSPVRHFERKGTRSAQMRRRWDAAADIRCCHVPAPDTPGGSVPCAPYGVRCSGVRRSLGPLRSFQIRDQGRCSEGTNSMWLKFPAGYRFFLAGGL